MKFIKQNKVTLIVTTIVILTIGITMTATGVTSKLALWNLIYDATNGRIRLVTETYSSTQSSQAYSELAILNSIADTTDNAIAVSLTGAVDTTSAGVVINEDNADADFRVEGSAATDTHLLFTDAGNGRVEIASGITGGTPDVPFHVVRADSYTHVSNNLAYIEYQSLGTPANGLAAALGLRVETAADNVETGAVIQATVDDVTGTSEDFALEFFVMTAGATATEKLSVGSTEVAVNDPSGDVDFRVESDGSTAALFVDAGNNRVGIFNTAPGVAVDITGVINADGGNFNFNEDSGDYDFKIETDSTDDAVKVDSGNSTFETNALTTTFNQGSADVDFIIESDDNASMFVVNAGDDRVAIGHAAPDDLFHVESQTALTNTVDYVARFAHDTSGVHAAGIGVGIEFEQETAATPNTEIGGTISLVSTDLTDTSEDFEIHFSTMSAGATATEKFHVGEIEVTVNDPGADIDFIVEGDSDANLISTDGASDEVGISTSDPDALLHVEAGTALDNTVTYPFRLGHDSSGTHAAGIGVGMQFVQETAATPNEEIGGEIFLLSTDLTDTSEDFDLVFSTMTAGATATEKFRVGSTETVANEGSVDQDFRVESDDDANIFTVDAANNRIGVSLAAPDRMVDIEESTSLTNTVTYPLRIGHETDGVHATSIGVGIEFEQETAATPTNEIGATIEVIATNIGDTTEAFDMVFSTMTAGAAASDKLRVGSTEVVVNEPSADVDFRVESDNQASMLHVEASSDKVGVAMSPRMTFDVTGKIRQSDFYWEDEFVVIDAPQWTTHVTTGSVAIQALTGGAERLTTGGVATNEESLDWNDITTFVNTQRPVVEFRVDLEEISNTEVGIGLKESEGVGVDDYIKIMFDASAQNTWYLQVSTGGTPTTDQGAVADTSTHIFRIEWTSDTALEWFIDGASQGTIATNVPTVALQPCIEVFTEEGSAHYIDIYYYKIWQDRT